MSFPPGELHVQLLLTYRDVYVAVQSYVPRQNLDIFVPSISSTIWQMPDLFRTTPEGKFLQPQQHVLSEPNCTLTNFGNFMQEAI